MTFTESYARYLYDLRNEEEYDPDEDNDEVDDEEEEEDDEILIMKIQLKNYKQQ